MSDRTLDRLLLARVARADDRPRSSGRRPGSTSPSATSPPALFVAAFVVARLQRRDDRAAAGPAITLCGLHAGVPGRLPGRLLRPRDEAGADFWAKGMVTWIGALRVPDHGRRPRHPRAAPRSTSGSIRWFVTGVTANAVYGIVQLALQVGAGVNLDKLVVGAADRRPGQGRRHQRVRAGGRHREHLPHQRAHRRPQPPGRDAVRAAAVAAAASTCPTRRGRRRLGLLLLFLLVRAGADAVAQRGAGRRRRTAGAVAGDPAAAAAAARSLVLVAGAAGRRRCRRSTSARRSCAR